MAKATADKEKRKTDFSKLYSEMMDLTCKEESFTASGSIILDAVISDGRGIPRGIFLELAGESGCGKSTMCLHIARRYCAQGKRVIYIDTESGLNGNQIDCFKMRDYVNEQLFVPVRLQTYGEVDEFLCKVLEDKDFIVNKSKAFANGFLKAYDIFGISNKFRNIDVSDLKTYSYTEGFEKTGQSLSKYIRQEN